jgi:hypothetical protein
MSIPIHLPTPSQQESNTRHLERPASVSTASTLGSPMAPLCYSATTSPSRISSRTQQGTSPALPGILDPQLSLNAHSLKLEFLRRDVIFARLIVAILAQRLEMGILSPYAGIGFPFTDKDKEERKVNCVRSTNKEIVM